jgi:hypothetical protein
MSNGTEVGISIVASGSWYIPDDNANVNDEPEDDEENGVMADGSHNLSSG